MKLKELLYILVIKFESSKRVLVLTIESTLEIHGLTFKAPRDVGSTMWLVNKGMQYTGFVPSPIGMRNGSNIAVDGCRLEYMVRLKQSCLNAVTELMFLTIVGFCASSMAF